MSQSEPVWPSIRKRMWTLTHREGAENLWLSIQVEESQQTHFCRLHKIFWEPAVSAKFFGCIPEMSLSAFAYGVKEIFEAEV